MLMLRDHNIVNKVYSLHVTPFLFMVETIKTLIYGSLVSGHFRPIWVELELVNAKVRNCSQCCFNVLDCCSVK